MCYNLHMEATKMGEEGKLDIGEILKKLDQLSANTKLAFDKVNDKICKLEAKTAQ